MLIHYEQMLKHKAEMQISSTKYTFLDKKNPKFHKGIWDFILLSIKIYIFINQFFIETSFSIMSFNSEIFTRSCFIVSL
ncbi:hypothetical protein C8C83_2126 [Flavobacterium sp. 90]|nr:hypothetical protein C8C82_2429 [Flavobacterium sp. 81]TCK54235.1 hypothetical protein C8C83_2126 [Flavobacterium sp. 90]